MTKLYSELAKWWPLLSAPADYAEEAAIYHQLLCESTQPAPRTLLELGSGGGNNASHLKSHYTMTLADASPDMLAVSRALNPECEHVQGDMRTMRLDRTFDAVFLHDAVDYMTDEPDLRAALETAFVHCRPGGVGLFAPDFVRETFVTGTESGGEGGAGQSLRFLGWTFDPDPSDTTYVMDFAIMLRDDGAETRVVHDHHVCGLFSRRDWLRLLEEVGLQPRIAVGEGGRDVFLARRPDRSGQLWSEPANESD